MRRIPAFWRAAGPSWPARALAPIGWVYGVLTVRRMRRNGFRAPVPVLSVGNFTAGGAGKTPSAMAIARFLQGRGETPFFITRGYRGREAGPLLVDAGRHKFGAVGDEALLLARVAPTILARDRAEGAKLACAAGATCLVLDDGLQNPALVKDFSLAVVDGGFGLGNCRVVPAGPLRAPLEAMVRHVDAVMVIGERRAGTLEGLSGAVAAFSGTIRPDAAASAELSGRKVFAFSGIGLPEKFEASLNAIGADLVGAARFADHHAFTPADAQRLIAAAAAHGAKLATTEKDFIRLAGHPALVALAGRTTPLPIAIDIDPRLLETLYRAVVSARKRISTASGPE